MKGLLVCAGLTCMSLFSFSQKASVARDYKKVFRTYPYSDPDPVPDMGKIYPYYRFDGYTNQPVNKEWKVVELENDFIRVMILPEVGGKIWAAIEKSTGRSFIYYNQVVKFRDVAMRGPWTSGGIEANYGIVGHTPNCATPVDYIILKKDDGSVSCVIGVLDLLTRTTWRIDINLPKDKAYFTTASTWYNASPFEQSYYTWMNAGIKAEGNLQFIYPGTKYIGHAGEHHEWPIDKKGRDVSFYENNNFGEYKSYHVFGKYTNFFGGYYHDEDFGMARYSTHDDKAGKKIWIWGLSQQGMIWEKLLTDNDGQYVEVQSGRLFNQPAEESSLTPFKNRGFTPHVTDTWKEYWFPVLKTKGFVAASDYGSLNIKKQNGQLLIYFSPVQPVNEELKITAGNKQLYSKKLNLKTLELFVDSVTLHKDTAAILIRIGDDKLTYEDAADAGNLARPYETPADFNWNSVQGLHIRGKEFIRQRMYTPAEEKMKASLQLDPYYLPALADLSMLLYRQMKYSEALETAKKALSVDTYDPASNYYYGLINEQMGNIADAKDGYDIASQSVEYRSAAYTRLSTIYLKENNFDKAALYADKCIGSNKTSPDAYQLHAVISRLDQNEKAAKGFLDTLIRIDPLNHFANFERYLWDSSAKNKKLFTGMIQNEFPGQTYLELAIWYYNAGQKPEAARVLELSEPNAEIAYWRAFLTGRPVELSRLQPDLIFPFRHETAEVLFDLLGKNDHWLLKYHLALIQWNFNNLSAAKKLFQECGEQPGYAPFYAARSKLFMKGDSVKAVADLQKARALDKNEWRYGRSLINYYLSRHEITKALETSSGEYKRFPSNYIIGMLYAKTLLENKDYGSAERLLQQIKVLPNEGSTAGRQLYHEVKLMLAVAGIRSGNCSKALKYLSEARLWPENLGSGKPYQEDIDERLEDWLAYQCMIKMRNKKEAGEMLDKIIKYTAGITERKNPDVKNLISAWALRASGREQEGNQLLIGISDKHPDNAIARWTLNTFNGKFTPVADGLPANLSYRVLEQTKEFTKL